MAIQWLVVLRYGVPHRTWVSREKIALLGRSSEAGRQFEATRRGRGSRQLEQFGATRRGRGSRQLQVTVQGSPASCASKKQVAPVVLVSRGLLNTCWKPQ